MNFFDKENNIIDFFQETPESNVHFYSRSPGCIAVFNSIYYKNQWNQWVDSSGKDMPPPDYYCLHNMLMMEVMRIDDHAHLENGKIVNPVNMMESRLQKELSRKLFDKTNHTNVELFINAITDLPTSVDHNYLFYLNNFKRVLNHHISKIDIYKNNHPGFKTIFLVMDESSGYARVEDDELAKTGIKRGQPFVFEPHYWFRDRAFLDCFNNVGIDYLVWFSPFKTTEEMARIMDLSGICVYDCYDINLLNAVDYPSQYMMSIEE